MTDTNVARASRLDTATLSDALDRHGLTGQCYKIKPRSSDFRMTGRAWTLLYGPAGSVPGTVGDYIDDVAPGSVIVLDNGVPMVDINKQRSSTGAPIAAAQWHHLAVVTTGNSATVFVDGASFGTLGTGLPALKSPMIIGKDTSGTGFVGEFDELNIAKVARTPGWIKFAAASQNNTSDAQKLVAVGADEAGHVEHESMLMEHVHLITDISKDLTPDGWAVIGACTLLAIVGGFVALFKVMYLNRINKATTAFMEQWEKVASDLTVLDDADDDSIRTMAGTARRST